MWRILLRAMAIFFRFQRVQKTVFNVSEVEICKKDTEVIDSKLGRGLTGFFDSDDRKCSLLFLFESKRQIYHLDEAL